MRSLLFLFVVPLLIFVAMAEQDCKHLHSCWECVAVEHCVWFVCVDIERDHAWTPPDFRFCSRTPPISSNCTSNTSLSIYFNLTNSSQCDHPPYLPLLEDTSGVNSILAILTGSLSGFNLILYALSFMFLVGFFKWRLAGPVRSGTCSIVASVLPLPAPPPHPAQLTSRCSYCGSDELTVSNDNSRRNHNSNLPIRMCKSCDAANVITFLGIYTAFTLFIVLIHIFPLLHASDVERQDFFYSFFLHNFSWAQCLS